MKKFLILMVLTVSVIGCAGNDISNNNEVTLNELLADRFKIDKENITVSQVYGIDIFEIALDTGEVFYSDSKAENLLIGRLIDKNDKDVTLLKEEEIHAKKIIKLMDSVDKNLAVKIGNGKKEVIEFTDVDCPYCFKAEDFFINSDVTRYIFFTPLDQLHPDAAMKSIHILCSDDKASEYQKVINNKVVDFKSCAAGVNALSRHREYGKLAGVRGTPHFIINNKSIVGADPKILEEIEAK